jgi:hypothetical protein
LGQDETDYFDGLEVGLFVGVYVVGFFFFSFVGLWVGVFVGKPPELVVGPVVDGGMNMSSSRPTEG